MPVALLEIKNWNKLLRQTMDHNSCWSYEQIHTYMLKKKKTLTNE